MAWTLGKHPKTRSKKYYFEDYLYVDEDGFSQVGQLIVVWQQWDTAGSYRFRSLIPSYLKDSEQVFLVYDTTSLASILEVEKEWVDLVVEHVPKGCPMVLVGSKIDTRSPVTTEVSYE